MNASIGITAMSWNSRTEKLDWPPSLRIRPFSFSVCRTIAVDDNEKMSPMATAIDQGWPNAIAIPVTMIAVSETCSPPRPSNLLRMAQSMLGCSSSPTRNSIMTTPNSAKCWMLTTSTCSQFSMGLMAIPASR